MNLDLSKQGDFVEFDFDFADKLKRDLCYGSVVVANIDQTDYAVDIHYCFYYLKTIPSNYFEQTG